MKSHKTQSESSPWHLYPCLFRPLQTMQALSIKPSHCTG